MSKVDIYLDAAAKNLEIALTYINTAYMRVDEAYDGNDPGYPAPDSQDARAWDYLDAIDEVRRAIGSRLNTWDEGDYYE